MLTACSILFCGEMRVNSKLILLVDDSKTQLLRLQMSLEKEGFEIITANDGLEGVSRAFMEKPNIVISDIIMPELNGYQLCRLLKNDKKTTHIPIILLTSLDQKQDRFWGMRAGADRYLIKSSELPELKEAINQLLSKAVQHPDDTKLNISVSRKNMDWKFIKSSVNHLLDKLLFESTLSSEARQLAKFIYNKNDLLKEVAELVNSLIDYTCLCLCLFDSKGTKLYFDLKHPLSENEIKKIKNYLFTIIDDDKKQENEETSFIQNSVKIDNSVADKVISRSIVPLNIHNECIGYLSFHAVKKNAFIPPESENIINLLAHDFSMVFMLMLLYDETKELSITDGLTNLYNKRYFMEIFEKEFERAKRFNSELSLIILDIDYFKSINDTYGHLQGDSVLKEIGLTLKESTRKIEFLARYGGEEFIIIAFNSNIDSTNIMAEKIRKSVESYNFKAEKKPLKLTISLGVASLTNNIKDKHDLIKRADEALYKAKEGGRNRVCLAK